MTADYATYFRGRNLWEFYESGVYRRVVDLPGQLGRCGSTLPSAQWTRRCSRWRSLRRPLDNDAVAEARRQVEWVFQTHVDLAPFYRMAGGRPVPGAAHDNAPGLPRSAGHVSPRGAGECHPGTADQRAGRPSCAHRSDGGLRRDLHRRRRGVPRLPPRHKPWPPPASRACEGRSSVGGRRSTWQTSPRRKSRAR